MTVLQELAGIEKDFFIICSFLQDYQGKARNKN